MKKLNFLQQMGLAPVPKPGRKPAPRTFRLTNELPSFVGRAPKKQKGLTKYQQKLGMYNIEGGAAGLVTGGILGGGVGAFVGVPVGILAGNIYGRKVLGKQRGRKPLRRK